MTGLKEEWEKGKREEQVQSSVLGFSVIEEWEDEEAAGREKKTLCAGHVYC